MGQAKSRKAEIDALKDRKFIVCSVADVTTKAVRGMSMPMSAPFIEIPGGSLRVCETMLSRFVNDRREAKELMDKWHFANWAFNYVKLGGDKFMVTIDVVDKKSFDKVNAEVQTNPKITIIG